MPVPVEKIIERIVYIEREPQKQETNPKEQGDGLSDLFAVLINSKFDVTEG